MSEYLNLIILTVGFLILLISANKLGSYVQKIKLPLITGLLGMGVLLGPYVFGFIGKEEVERLDFINEIALVFIAFAAGAELHWNEFRSRISHIVWVSLGQIFLVSMVGTVVFYLLSGVIPFTKSFSVEVRLVISLFLGTISLARSPASTMAVINELRARGPFTQTALGATILIDVLSITIFAVVFSFTQVLLNDGDFKLGIYVILFAELLLAFVLGLVLGNILNFLMGIKIPSFAKTTLVLLAGLGVYLLSHFVRHYSSEKWGIDFYFEPLLVNIIGSFYLTNYSRYRREFGILLEKTMPFIYAAFFTLIGASISFDILKHTWSLALLLFGLRIVLLIAGSWLGGTIAGDSQKVSRIYWMPFVTQAGVSLGLITVVMGEGHAWSYEFGTILIGAIILNQLVGPPLFKFAIHLVNEHHNRGPGLEVEGENYAIIFGHGQQALILAQQLTSQGWSVCMVTSRPEISLPTIENLRLKHIPELTKSDLVEIRASSAEAVVVMKTDDENYKIGELFFEHYGTTHLVVRLNDRENFNKFRELGALIVEPSTAIVSLLDHMVRSPNATSLLLGHEANQDAVDIVLRNKDFSGIPLRNLDLPPDILILTTKRKGQAIISTGFTRLRRGDVITVVGSIESIEQMKVRFE